MSGGCFFCVRVLTGPHEGAEMGIPVQGLTIGSDELCDLILFDDQVVSQHIRLIPESQWVMLQPLHGIVLLDMAPVKENTKLSYRQVITIGATHLAVGRMGEEWPTIGVSPRSRKEVSDAASQQGLPEKTNRAPLPTIIAISGLLVILTAYVALKHLGRRGRGDNMMSRDVGNFSSSEKGRPKKSEIHEAIDSRLFPLEAKVATQLSQSIEDVAFSLKKQKGKSQLTIWVRGGSESAIAHKILSPFSPPLSYHVLDLVQIETSATMLSQLYGVSLQVHVKPGGDAFWSGYLQHERAWHNFCLHITRELPSIHNHQCKVIFGDQLVKLLQYELQQNGLQIQPIASKHGILLIGTVLKEQEEQLAAWIVQARTRYGSYLSIIDKVNSNTIVQIFSKNFFPSRVVGVSAAATTWVTLADGSKFFPGSKLKNGYILEKINSDILLLDGPGGKLKLPLSVLY